MAIDPFEFHYVDGCSGPWKDDCRGVDDCNVKVVLVKEGEHQTFTNRLWHRGGVNKTNRCCYRLFMYEVKNKAHIPLNSVYLPYNPNAPAVASASD
jgi:hypothetical protein